MPGPLVTVAVSTYNRASGYLREALECALRQTYAPLEIVVVDNASTDDTGRLVASLSDDRVRYVRNEKNVGANGNFNACLQHARGAYFLLLHDDDHIDDDFVAYAMAGVARAEGSQPPGLIRTGNRVIDAQGSILSQRRNEAPRGTPADLARAWFQRQTSMYFCNTIFQTSALREVGGFHSKRELYVDVFAVFRIAARYPVLNLPEVKASFRRHGGNNGTAESIAAWCEDSMELVDLICEVAPEDADELRSVGLTYFTSNNYVRAGRLTDPVQRLRAYWLVYRYFGYRKLPFRGIARRRYRDFRRVMGGSTP